MPKYVNQDEEPKGLSTKQIALIGVVVVVQILFIVAIFFGDDEKEEIQQPPAQTAEQVKPSQKIPVEIPQINNLNVPQQITVEIPQIITLGNSKLALIFLQANTKSRQTVTVIMQ